MPLLYTTVPFHFKTLEALNTFLATVPTQRVLAIRSLTFRAFFPYLLFPERLIGRPSKLSKVQHFDAEAWTRAWISLAGIEGLRVLKVRLEAREYRDVHPEWPETPSELDRESLFGPMSAVKGCGDFEVEVSWPVSEEEKALELPFKLQTMVKGGDEEEQGSREDGVESDGD